MYLIDNLHAYGKDSEEFYRDLIKLVRNANGKRIEDIILSEVNVQSIDIGNIYSLWKTSNSFQRWLIQNYVLMKGAKNSYLYQVMSCMEELSEGELLEKVYECIFDLKDVSVEVVGEQMVIPCGTPVVNGSGLPVRACAPHLYSCRPPQCFCFFVSGVTVPSSSWIDTRSRVARKLFRIESTYSARSNACSLNSSSVMLPCFFFL